MVEEARQAVPLKRFGEPHELADLAVYLMSPMAAFLNGECVVIDGGEWLHQGQEFSRFTDLPREQVKGMLEQLKPKK
jgi:enoyl-[acyl-carrier-protein] reductase (NADH)